MSLYTQKVIRSFRHRGLKRLHDGDPSKIEAALRAKVERVLDLLDVASEPQAINLPGFRLHPLKGDLQDFWSISVSGNWRIVFRFVDGHVFDVDLIDYH